jgi:tetratricopeptide (TPR) repeat protein
LATRALRAHRELVGLHRGIYGPRSLGVAVNAMNIGLVHVHLADFQAAADSLRLSYDIFREVYGPDQFDVINASRNLAYPLLRLGQTEEAYARMDEALAWFRRTAGPNALESLFQELLNQGADVTIDRPLPMARAESLLVRFRALPPERSQNLPDILLHVAWLASLPGDPAGLARAESTLDEALDALNGRYPDTQLTMATTRVLREYVRYKRNEPHDAALLRRLGPVVMSNGLSQPRFVEALRPLVGS